MSRFATACPNCDDLHLGEVVGKGGVTFVDGRSVRFDNASEVTKGRQLQEVK